MALLSAAKDFNRAELPYFGTGLEKHQMLDLPIEPEK
jgi:hypothetical protein